MGRGLNISPHKGLETLTAAHMEDREGLRTLLEDAAADVATAGEPEPYGGREAGTEWLRSRGEI